MVLRHMTDKEKNGITRKITLPGGTQVGILDLDDIIKKTSEAEISDTIQIEEYLLAAVKECNYVPDSAEKEYAAALLKVYLAKYGDVPSTGRIEPKRKHAG
ncbi:MAG: hypothetical protein JW712_05070 [Dehalococcoidales bacterium]|nr:hypothetical protein [Dehalococcoidales bacterium]